MISEKEKKISKKNLKSFCNVVQKSLIFFLKTFIDKKALSETSKTRFYNKIKFFSA